MFFDAVPQSDGNIRTIWLPEYANGGGRWRIIPGVPNWPKVEAELRKLADREEKSLSDDAASGRGDAHLIDSARRRILGSDYDPVTVFGGKHADAAPHVEQMCQSIADPSNPAHDWESAYKQLDLDGREIVSKLEIKETNLNLTSHEKHVNHPDLYQKYERSITRDLPEDSWVHTYMQETGSIHGRPETIVTHVDSIASEGLEELCSSRSFSNVERGLEAMQ